MEPQLAKNNQSGLRLDLFLKEQFQFTRKEAKRLLDSGRIRVNERKVIIASWELAKGDLISIQPENKASQNPSAKDYFLKVVYEDDDVIVVEKESGIASEPTPTSLKPAMPEIVKTYLKRAHPHLPYPHVLPLHRLDRPTSGLMVYGKSKRAEPLLEAFKIHAIGRRYTALVEGSVKKDQGIVDAPLIKNPIAKGQKMTVDWSGAGKKAVTEYRVIHRYTHQTLLELDLKTGRTHQVRAHLAYLGHPILGDNVYGRAQAASSPDRIALHASELRFIHPVSGKKMTFRSAPPRNFKSLVEKMLQQTIGAPRQNESVRLSQRSQLKNDKLRRRDKSASSRRRTV